MFVVTSIIRDLLDMYSFNSYCFSEIVVYDANYVTQGIYVEYR